MKMKVLEQPRPGNDGGTEQPDRRVLALARALGRYQALRDMAAQSAASDEQDEPADHRAWPTGPAKPRMIDLYSLDTTSGFLPGFVAYATTRTVPGTHHRR